MLAELAANEPAKLDNMITIYNKCDQVKTDTEDDDDESFVTRSSINDQVDDVTNKDRVLYISCSTLQGLDECRQLIEREIYKCLNYVSLRLLVKQARFVLFIYIVIMNRN